jgi:hypothetical protein
MIESIKPKDMKKESQYTTKTDVANFSVYSFADHAYAKIQLELKELT